MEFPDYTYVPGNTPHPDRSETEHLQFDLSKVQQLTPENWETHEAYLFGIDLFNHGYYWEAHECWEAVWHANGRAGVVASLLRGLIKLAAAGVKVRESNASGIKVHAKRAEEIFRELHTQIDSESLAGMTLSALPQIAFHMMDNTEPKLDDRDEGVTPELRKFLPIQGGV